MTERYLRREEAAKYLQRRAGIGTVRWLAKLATVGGGPPFYKVTRYPIYKIVDLDAWLDEKMSRPYRSTSDYKGKRK